MNTRKDVQVKVEKTDVAAELEKAVQILLKQPHVFYLKELHSIARTDPTYIFNNESAVCTEVHQILANEGVHWKPDFLKRQWMRVLGIAFHRIEDK